jgi:hypothetical protein
VGRQVLVNLAIPIYPVPAGTLLQHVSRMQYSGSPLYYGNGGECRYDDPSLGYGVLYLGFDLETALMESVFHQHKWISGRRAITTTEVAQRLVRAVGVLQDMRLADLTAPNVMASTLGLNLHQLTSRRYTHTQKVSATVHNNKAPDGRPYDGILFPSRNNFPGKCVALFSRSHNLVCVEKDIPLARHRDWPEFLRKYQVGIKAISKHI